MTSGPGFKCATSVLKDFSWAIFFDVDPPIHDGIDIASVVGGEGGNLPQAPPPPVIREVSLILDGTFYTAVYEAPWKANAKFSGLRRNVGIPARVDGDALFVHWPAGKEVKAKIIRRQRIHPNHPQPA
jgi:hypothetical protein